MNITSAKYETKGTVRAVVNGVTVSGISPTTRYWGHIEDWVAEGNTIDPADPAASLPTDDEIYDQLMQQNRILKALALSLNDGSFVPGANATNAQLKDIIKAKM